MRDDSPPPPFPTRPANADPQARLGRVRRLAWWLDERFRIPGTPIRFGLDGIASIVPVAGDTLTLLIALAVPLEAARLGVSRGVLLRMAANLGLDWAVGSIPVLGTLFDICFKANSRNLRLLERHLREVAERDRPAG